MVPSNSMTDMKFASKKNASFQHPMKCVKNRLAARLHLDAGQYTTLPNFPQDFLFSWIYREREGQEIIRGGKGTKERG